MHLVRERMPISGTANRATLAGVPTDPLRYREFLVEGFESAYRLLAQERDALLAEGGPIASFGDDPVRYVPRPTSVYSRVLAESMHPDVLRDALDWEYVLEAGLAGGHQGIDGRIELLTSEQRQLARLDVPTYHTTPRATDLYDRDGVVVQGFLAASGMDTVRTKIRRMGTDDLRRQKWCIEASLTGLTFGTQVRPASRACELPGQALDTELALRAATALADELLDTAVHGTDDQPPHWLSLNVVGERYWRAGPAGISLYDGVSGIALFLAYLSSMTGEQRYRAVAERVAGQLADSLTSPERTSRSRIALSIGAFGELGGAIYVLTHLAALWDAPGLLDSAGTLVPELAGRFADDRELDVVQGTAGAALALVALHRTRPDERVVDALRLAGSVLAKAAVDMDHGVAWYTAVDPDRPLLGMSHGASGFALGLGRIAEVTGEDRLYRLCEEAVRFERHRLAPDRGNWPDLRSIVPEGSFMNAWCHGAAGIGLVRAELLGMEGLAGVRRILVEDLRVARDRVHGDLLREGTYVGLGNDSLCHGDLGLVATLLAAGRALEEDDELGPRVTRAVADRVLAGDIRPGVPMGVSTPGLMTGAAGIGYGLLRTAAPGRVPEVLTLAAPRG
jgi:type 2 lantibiotic biosynthesis protein LanM